MALNNNGTACYDLVPPDNIAITFSGNSRHQIPDMSFDMVLPDTLPNIPEVRSPVTTTFLPLAARKSSRGPAVVDNDIVGVVLIKEAELFGLARGVSHESGGDLEYVEGLHIIRDVLTSLFRYGACQCQNLDTSQQYIEILESELFTSRDLEDKSYERKLKLLKQFVENTVQSRKFVMTFHQEGEARLKLLGRIDSEIAAAKKTKPLFDPNDLSPNQKLALAEVRKIWYNTLTRKAKEEREKEREDDAGE